jgi:hypothetical protein
MPKTNIPNIIIHKPNASKIQNYRNVLKILEKMVVHSLTNKETD